MKNETIGLYLLHNTNTDETYVGSGILRIRKNDHFNKLKNNKHQNYKLQRAYNKDPNFDFVSIPVEESDLSKEQNRQLALKLEQQTIDQFKNNPLFLNIALEAQSIMSGRKHSEETKTKLSIILKGKKRSEEQIENMRLGKIGTKHSEETKQKMRDVRNTPEMIAFCSNLNKGRVVTDETKNKNRISNTGQKRSEETKEKIRLKALNRIITEETRQKISDSNKGKIRNETFKNIISEIKSKPVSINGVIYKSVTAAAEQLKINYESLRKKVNDIDFKDCYYI